MGTRVDRAICAGLEREGELTLGGGPGDGVGAGFAVGGGEAEGRELKHAEGEPVDVEEAADHLYCEVSVFRLRRRFGLLDA